MGVKEVPSDHDFFDLGYVKKWTDSIVRYRPERQQLFKAFAAEAARIQKDRLSVLEPGCGPGFLAEQLLQNRNISRYTLIDFSPHMLELSRENICQPSKNLVSSGAKEICAAADLSLMAAEKP